MNADVGALEKNVMDIEDSLWRLKHKDKEILDVLLKTKLLLDRQKIEDLKLRVLEDENVDEGEEDYLAEKLEERSNEIFKLQETIRSEFMGIINENASSLPENQGFDSNT